MFATDNDETREYLKNAIKSMDTETIVDERIVNYDFYENRNCSAIRKFSELCTTKGNLVVATGIGKYAEHLLKNQKIDKLGQFYMNVFNMPRDAFYLENKVRLILLIDQSEYDMFQSEYCDDFTSYVKFKSDLDFDETRAVNVLNDMERE